MSVTRTGVGRLITTPYGEARINAEGRVLWAEWEVWRHAEELVADGLWTSATAPHRHRQRTVFHVVSVDTDE